MRFILSIASTENKAQEKVFLKNVVCPRLHQTCMNMYMYSGTIATNPLVSYEICNECLSQSLKVGISDFVPEVGSDRQPLGPPLCVRGSRSVGVAPITGGSRAPQDSHQLADAPRTFWRSDDEKHTRTAPRWGEVSAQSAAYACSPCLLLAVHALSPRCSSVASFPRRSPEPAAAIGINATTWC